MPKLSRKIMVCPHPDRPCKAKQRCGSCYEKWLIENKPGYHERRLGWRKSFNARHSKERVAWQRIYLIKRLYGLSEEDYRKLSEKQNNRCAICGQESTPTRCLAVDHDHTTGTVRGLLCLRCNTKLGWYETHKQKILEYLGEFMTVKAVALPTQERKTADNDVTLSVASNKPVFTDISNEKYRTYTFPTGSYTITEPVKLNVKRKPEGDSHRVVDATGKAHYIPAGWIALSWEGKNGEAYSF